MTIQHSPRPGVAAWDFDETITTHDTLVPFLAHVGGKAALAKSLATHSPLLVRGLRSSDRRDEAKERVLADILRGRHVDEVTHAGLQYARTLPALFRRESLERIGWHRDQGHRLVIVSASLVYYLRPIATELGFDEVIGVDMEVGPDDRLTGALVGRNVRKAEKAVRLTSWIETQGLVDPEIWAYGDSSGDEELLAMSHYPRWHGKRSHLNDA
ncbi:MAG: HAD-IB family hydrolase [Actinobacteria bacterium]|nr:HAD-IB family hydrolase [Actinomycetota bacterium]